MSLLLITTTKPTQFCSNVICNFRGAIDAINGLGTITSQYNITYRLIKHILDKDIEV